MLKGKIDLESWCKANNRQDLLNEWDYDKNIEIDPSGISSGSSSKKIFWICKKGHSYQAYVYNRTTLNAGCPYCAGKLLKGYNDLLTINPQYLEEWDYDKNLDISPDECTLYSHKKAWWKCKKCGNSWETAISTRSEGRGCPACGIVKRSSKSRVKKGKNDLESWCKTNNRQDLLDEWDIEKNGLAPDQVAMGSHKVYGWICSTCHNSLDSNIPNRRFGNNCPYCSNQKVKEGFNDFVTYCKNNELEYLLEEWDYKKNKKKPSEITHGTAEKFWWICNNCNYSYEARISHRIMGRSCPYCKDTGRKKVMKGLNDFQSYCKEHGGDYLLEEWDYNNNPFGPDEITVTSTKIVSWKCKRCGTKFKLLTAKRIRGDGCPKCSYYLKTSFREQALFYYIKQVIPDAQNRYIFDGIELDIYIPSNQIGIEYDGQYWHQDIKRDKSKNQKCEKNGITLLRVREPQCAKLSDETDNNTFNMKKMNDKELECVISAVLVRLGKGDVDVDLSRDRLIISSTYLNTEYEQSLECCFPEIAKDWIIEKNEGIDPSRVYVKSTIKAWWLCPKCGNEYQKRVFERTVKHSGCQYCTNRKIRLGFNDLATTHPDVAAQWNYKRNGDLKPTEVTYGCDKKVWWICDKGHEWQAPVYTRTKGMGCPYCSNFKVLVGYNDLATTNPDIAAQWNYEKNGNLKPTMVIAGSNKKVWWNNYNCKHCFEQTIHNRVKNLSCPVCAGRQGKKYIKIETGEEYYTLKTAAESCGKASTTSLFKCIKGEIETAYGFHWKEIMDDEYLI